MIKEIEIFRENYLKDYQEYQVNKEQKYLIFKPFFIYISKINEVVLLIFSLREKLLQCKLRSWSVTIRTIP